ncbi:MAG: type II toxin-antitoxin system VapC family toxin [Aridibacter sp.]
MENKVFLDTSYLVALIIEKDENHEKAVELSLKIEQNEIQIYTTQAIILEIGNSLSKLKYRQSAIGLIDFLRSDSSISIITLDTELFDAAFELFSNRSDKEWGLIDCASFIVMQEQEITDALTADEHFVQAGFRALLRE